jgi:hypothetical protein
MRERIVWRVIVQISWGCAERKSESQYLRCIAVVCSHGRWLRRTKAVRSSSQAPDVRRASRVRAPGTETTSSAAWHGRGLVTPQTARCTDGLPVSSPVSFANVRRCSSVSAAAASALDGRLRMLLNGRSQASKACVGSRPPWVRIPPPPPLTCKNTDPSGRKAGESFSPGLIWRSQLRATCGSVRRAPPQVSCLVTAIADDP